LTPVIDPVFEKAFPMRKALLPMIASLALCGAATGALIATNARAEQSGRKPLMLALTAQDGAPGGDAAGPAPGMAPPMMRDRGARRAQFCKDIYARKVGELAFMEAKLSLTGSEQPLFDRWKQVSLDLAKQRQGDCASREGQTPGQRPNVVDRLNTEEAMLKKRLANIDAEKPSLSAFYSSLTPEQKQEFTRTAMHPMEGHMHMHMMMGMMGGPHPGMGGRMGRGPMGGLPGPVGPGPMGPGSLGDAPPPPPAQ
jgi:LTXXQ motif family protein